VSAATTPDPGVPEISSARRSIVVALKRGGPQSAEQLARRLGISIVAVRQHLTRLCEDGLAIRNEDSGEQVHARRGRPTHFYEASTAADALFPQRYGDLTTELLGYLGGPKSPEVDRLFDLRRQRRLDAANRRLEGTSFDERVVGLAAILDEDGYLAEAVQLAHGHWRIVEHHCAIRSVAEGFRQACGSELAFVRAVLPEAHVQRVAHLMDGAHSCAYDVVALSIDT
jgi:DeoR family transcriptional regulator, suf operon transcriptional repressor